ncbi:MAG: sigma-70 family RNA polymerase sigma factor [Planctomycetota bacterium]
MIGADAERVLLEKLRGSRAESEEGLQQLHDLTRSSLFGLALRMTGRPDLADDAVQETFVDVIRGLRSFRGDARLTTWLYRIAVRASTRIAVRSKQAGQVLPEELEATAAGPGESAEQRDGAARVLRAIAKLPANQRAVVALSALKELPQTEVAEILGVPTGTVYSRLHSARARLSELLRSD